MPDENATPVWSEDAGAAKPDAQPVVEDVNQLKARLSGLDKAYTTRQQQWTTEKQQLQGIIADLTGRERDWQSKHSELSQKTVQYEKSMQELTTFKAEAEKQAATYKSQLSRKDLFMSADYRDLADFESQGLLRNDLDGDALKEYLGKYKNTLTNLRKGAVQETLTGATPSAAPGTRSDGEMTKEMIDKQLNDAINRGDMKAFEELNASWVKMVAKKP